MHAYVNMNMSTDHSDIFSVWFSQHRWRSCFESVASLYTVKFHIGKLKQTLFALQVSNKKYFKLQFITFVWLENKGVHYMKINMKMLSYVL